MKFSKKWLAALLMVSGLVTSVGFVHQAQAAYQGSSGSGTYSGAVRVYGYWPLPNGGAVWSHVVTVVGPTLISCQQQLDPYLTSGGHLVRACQQGIVNLDGESVVG